MEARLERRKAIENGVEWVWRLTPRTAILRGTGRRAPSVRPVCVTHQGLSQNIHSVLKRWLST